MTSLDIVWHFLKKPHEGVWGFVFVRESKVRLERSSASFEIRADKLSRLLSMDRPVRTSRPQSDVKPSTLVARRAITCAYMCPREWYYPWFVLSRKSHLVGRVLVGRRAKPVTAWQFAVKTSTTTTPCIELQTLKSKLEVNITDLWDLFRLY